MRALARGLDDLFGGQANALVVDLHPAIAGAEGDLLGTVGMPVEPRSC